MDGPRLTDTAVRRISSSLPVRWVGGVVLRVGEREVSVVADDVAMVDHLRTMFQHLTIDAHVATDEFGLSTMRRAGAGPRLIPELSFNGELLLRSRSTTRLLRRLDIALGNLARAPEDGHRIRGMAALVRSGSAVLVPESLVIRSTAVERAIAEAGATIVESVAIRLDLERGSANAVAGLVHPEVAASDDLSCPPGTYELVSIMWDPVQVDARERLSTSAARLSQLITRPSDVDRQVFLDQIVALASRCRFGPISLDESGVTAALSVLV